MKIEIELTERDLSQVEDYQARAYEIFKLETEGPDHFNRKAHELNLLELKHVNKNIADRIMQLIHDQMVIKDVEKGNKLL